MCDIEIFYVTSNGPVEKIINDVNCKAFDPIIIKIDFLLVPITVCRDSLYIKLINKVKVTAFVCVCACVYVLCVSIMWVLCVYMCLCGWCDLI